MASDTLGRHRRSARRTRLGHSVEPCRSRGIVLGALLLVGVPWIVAPCSVAVIWVCGTRKPTGTRRTTSRWNATTWLLVISIGLLCGTTAASLSLVQRTGDPIQLDILEPPPIALWAAVIALSAANAFGEEILWRGLLASELHTSAPAVRWATQFASFGAAHWFGLPAGVSGAILAGTFSVIQYWLSRKKGMLAAVATHAIVDFAIFAAVTPSILFTAWYTAHQ